MYSVVIAIAMEAEAKPFIEHLKLDQSKDFFNPRSSFQAYQGKYNECNLTVITNGNSNTYKVKMIPPTIGIFR